MVEQAPKEWQVQKKPPLIQRRFDFADYAVTRQFLDFMTGLSESTGYYPDLNFGRTHVNVSVAASQGEPGPAEYSFAAQVNALAERASAQMAD